MLDHASTTALAVACVIAGVLAFAAGVVATALIRRYARRHHLRVGRRPVWRAPLTLLIVVLAVRAVCSAVREGLVSFLLRDYPTALPGRPEGPPAPHANSSQP